MNKIPMLEKFAAQSLVEHDGELIFSKEKFAELIVRECMTMCDTVSADYLKHRKGAFDFQDKNIYAEGEAACDIIKYKMKKHFGVDGMSTEDKKTLIKELLGVKNETN